MSKKLGEILIEDGRITEPQLQKALKAQLIFGGHLGTSLIELGYLDEDTLGETLSRAFNVPYATYDILSNVPYSVIRAIPAKLVEKYKVVPLRIDGKVLQLAMLDPKNLMALDEISFVTGYKIDAWVSPEIRIYQVLEKYYNLSRSQRYITLARELGKLRSRGERIHPDAEGAAAEEDAGPDGAAPEAVEVATAPVPQVEPAPALPPAREPATRGAVDHWEKYGYGKSWREFADAMERKSPAAGPGVAPPEPAARPSPPPPRGSLGTSPEEQIAEASRRLAVSSSPEDVAEVLVNFAARYGKRVALFIVRGEQAVGWGGVGEGFISARIRGINLFLSRDSMFSLIEDGRTHYVGQIPPYPSVRRFFHDLNVPMPRAALLLPVRIKEKLASVLYLDGGNEDDLRSLDADLFERLAQKASLALQMIILRQKILST